MTIIVLATKSSEMLANEKLEISVFNVPSKVEEEDCSSDGGVYRYCGAPGRLASVTHTGCTFKWI